MSLTEFVCLVDCEQFNSLSKFNSRAKLFEKKENFVCLIFLPDIIFEQSSNIFLPIFISPIRILTFTAFCRTPGYKMGRCVSIYECDYLLNILSSKSLTQQSIAFLKLSQCDAGHITRNVPHVCCARNDDSLIWESNAGDGIHDKSFDAPSAINTAEKDDSIIYKSSNSLLPKTNECGREKIENRIYSGQVSLDVWEMADKLLVWKEIVC